MTNAQRQLLETLSGHLSLLRTANPRKASSSTAKACKKYVREQLRSSTPQRKAA